MGNESLDFEECHWSPHETVNTTLYLPLIEFAVVEAEEAKLFPKPSFFRFSTHALPRSKTHFAYFQLLQSKTSGINFKASSSDFKKHQPYYTISQNIK